MILINKKRIGIILSCIFIGMFAFSFQIANNNENSINSNNIVNNTKETVATPVSGKTVVLDAGHGVPDERSTEQ
ncbi:MAG: hypothetical protein HFJ40_06430 [Clostridia bacterium]|nr:hypothetical protein [Clostridia bacterium]